MITRTWIGGGNNQASNPNDWSPAGAPQPGDTLLLSNGTMNISGNDLAGDPVTLTSNGTNTAKPILSLKNSALTVQIATYADSAPTINALGTSDTLNIPNTYPSDFEATVDIANHTSLVTTDYITFGKLVVNGGSTSHLTFTGPSYFYGTNVLLATPYIDGNGSIVLGSLMNQSSQMEITGAVTNPDFAIAVRGDPSYPAYAGLTLDHPAAHHGSQFAGGISLGYGYVELGGLKADSFSYDGSVLTLYAGKTVVDTVNIKTEDVNNLPRTLVVEQSKYGVMLSVEGTTSSGGTIYSDISQPGGPGVVVPTHHVGSGLAA